MQAPFTRSGLALAAALTLAVPGAPMQAFPGLPLTAPGLFLAAVALVAWLGFPGLSRGVTRWLLLGLGGALLLKLTLAVATPPLGLTARYWAGTAPEGPPERSTDFRWLQDATRVDLALDHRGNTFAVHFFNDTALFNFGADVRPSRDQLPFAVRWDGALAVPSDGPRRFRIEAVGAARVWLDGAELLLLPPAEGVQVAEAQRALAAGLHPLRVEYVRPEARAPRLRLAWEPRPGATLETLAAPLLYREVQAGPSALATGLLATRLAYVADALVAIPIVAWLLAGLLALRRQPSHARVRAGLAAIPLLFLAHGIALHWDVAGRATILSGQDDWLLHESLARDILLNGPLMTGGQDAAPPYYAQPLYPYVLAAAHVLAGEGLFGPLALQAAALGLVLLLTALLGARLFGRLGGLAALALFWAFLQQEHLRVARQLLNENLYMPLVMASLLVLVAFAQRRRPPRWWVALLAGGMLGLTALARSQFLLFVPFGLLPVWLAWARGPAAARRRSALALVAMAAGLLAVITPATARNWAVSGRFVLISSAAGTNLLKDHAPPHGFDLGAIDRDPLYEALGLNRETRTVLEYARRDPLGYFGTWLPLGAHSIGLTGLRRGDGSVYWGFLATFGLYLMAFALPRTRRLEAWPVHAFVGSHLLVMMLFEATTYGFRLVVPMYAPVAAVAAQAPLAALRWLAAGSLRPKRRDAETRGWESGRVPSIPPVPTPRHAAAAAAAFALGTLTQQALGLAAVWPGRELAYHGISGSAAHAALTADREAASMVYVASGDGSPRRFGAGNLPGLRYPPLKWFDPSRAVPVPPQGARAVYLLSEVAYREPEVQRLTACLGMPDVHSERVLDYAEAARLCLSAGEAWRPIEAQFGTLAQIDTLALPPTAEAGEQVEALLTWRILRRPSERYQAFIHAQDVDAADPTILWGNGTAELYPASEWEPGERLLGRLPVATDPTAVPGPYRLMLGFAAVSGDGASLPATWAGGSADRVPAGTLELQPGSMAQGTPEEFPPGMRPLEQRIAAGGLELLAARAPARSARPGDRVHVGLLWRAVDHGPVAAHLRFTLVQADGQVVQEVVAPLLGGRYPPHKLRAGSVVRDEHTLLVAARAPNGPLMVYLDVLDSAGRALGGALLRQGAEPATVEVEGRERTFELPADIRLRERASFGDKVELLGYQLEPGRIQPGSPVTLRLYWRALSEMDISYKVFTHILDARAEQVLVQRDDEPRQGAAPTTGWLPGEVLADEYRLHLPASTPSGEYPVELGLYDPRTGERLPLPNGETRFILSTPLRVG